MRLGEVDRVDRTSQGRGEFVDQLDTGMSRECCSCAHGEVEVAVGTLSSGGKRAEQDGHAHGGMSFQDRGNGGPNRGIRFTLTLHLSADGTHGCSGITKPPAMQAAAGRLSPVSRTRPKYVT